MILLLALLYMIEAKGIRVMKLRDPHVLFFDLLSHPEAISVIAEAPLPLSFRLLGQLIGLKHEGKVGRDMMRFESPQIEPSC